VPTQLETATAYVTAFVEKRFDDALAVLTEDVILDTPMGPKKGKASVKSALGILHKLGGAKLPLPFEENGVVKSNFRTPMGKAVMTFVFDGELIQHLSVKT
jgi:hypothetical protein